eukprot:scaffold22.g6057.t1
MADEGVRLFDAHCHLQDERVHPDQVAVILEEASASGVRRLAVNGCWPEDWGRVLELAAQHPGVLAPNCGLHPWWVGRGGGGWLQSLRRLLEDHPGCGLGELLSPPPHLSPPPSPRDLLLSTPSPLPRTFLLSPPPATCYSPPPQTQCGLDKGPRAKELPPFKEQLRAFEQQLALAQELRRPVSVHCVRAYGALLDALQRAALDVPVVLHSWVGSQEMVGTLLQLPARVHFSLSGYLTRLPPAKAIPMARAIPPDRLLLESDSPDGALSLSGAWVEALPHLASLAARAERYAEGTTPAVVACTLEVVAAARGEDAARVAAASYDNAAALFDASAWR